MNESEVKMKELENTIRLQEQNIKAKDGSINKQKMSLEKLRNEMKEKTSDIAEKSGMIEKLESDLKTREVCLKTMHWEVLVVTETKLSVVNEEIMFTLFSTFSHFYNFPPSACCMHTCFEACSFPNVTSG